MRKRRLIFTLSATLLAGVAPAQTTVHTWSLKDCISYALEHNIGLKRERASVQTAEINVKEAKAGWLPSLNASLTQGVTYRPFQETTGNLVNGGIASSASTKATQSGAYGVNASWTVWNGGATKLNIKNNELAQAAAEYSVETEANSLQEQIVQLYVQILYTQEAAAVNRELLRQDSVVYERGKEMLQQGQISRSDLVQLEAQVISGYYDVVNVGTQIASYKTQLKQLLELEPAEEINVTDISLTENSVTGIIPSKMDIYEAALGLRPEIKGSRVAIEQSEVATRQARAAYMPTISMTGGLGDSHITGTQNNFFNQMKNNFNANIGVSVSIPIFDNRKTKSSVQRAQVAQLTSELDLQDKEKQLYSSIENYWLNATNSQQKYIAAKSNVESLQTSYDLIQEQFRLGLKNIVELLESRSKLLTAKQDLLQDKYTTVLNRALLEFYGGQEISL